MVDIPKLFMTAAGILMLAGLPLCAIPFYLLLCYILLGTVAALIVTLQGRGPFLRLNISMLVTLLFETPAIYLFFGLLGNNYGISAFLVAFSVISSIFLTYTSKSN